MPATSEPTVETSVETDQGRFDLAEEQATENGRRSKMKTRDIKYFRERVKRH